MRSISRPEGRPRRPAALPAGGLRAFLIFALLALVVPAAAAIEFAPGFVPGRFFDPATSGWGQRLISLYRDDEGRITLRGGNGRGRVEVGLSPDEAHRLVQALMAGLTRLRQSPQADDAGDIVELLRIVHGRGIDVDGLAVSLLGSGPETQGPALQLFLQDRERPIAHMALYLGPAQVERLERLLTGLLAMAPQQKTAEAQ